MALAPATLNYKKCAILTNNLCIILRYKFQKSSLWAWHSALGAAPDDALIVIPGDAPNATPGDKPRDAALDQTSKSLDRLLLG